jgi:hypothetical protein
MGCFAWFSGGIEGAPSQETGFRRFGSSFALSGRSAQAVAASFPFFLAFYGVGLA